jgi:nuclear polyadenylated RNA-binding protein NAB2
VQKTCCLSVIARLAPVFQPHQRSLPARLPHPTAVHTKLLEVGWGSEDDTSLAEFIVLMLVNGKTEDQIASELASDILPEGEGTQEFAHWLFDQVRLLQSGGSATTADGQGGQQSIPSFQDSDDGRRLKENQSDAPATYDSDMADGSAAAPDNA